MDISHALHKTEFHVMHGNADDFQDSRTLEQAQDTGMFSLLSGLHRT
jgi:hypothetical protein